MSRKNRNGLIRTGLSVGFAVLLVALSTGCRVKRQSVNSSGAASAQAMSIGNSSGSGTAPLPSSTPNPVVDPLDPVVLATAECLNLCANEPSGICNCEEAAVMQAWDR